jgi:hypothetical protein
MRDTQLYLGDWLLKHQILAITKDCTYFCPGPEELTGLCRLGSLGLLPLERETTH